MKRALAVGLLVAVVVLMCCVVSLPTEDVVRLCGHCIQFSQFQAPLVGESAEYRQTMVWQKDGETSKLEFSTYLEVIDSTVDTYTVKAWYKVLEASGVYEGMAQEFELDEIVIDSNTHMIVGNPMYLCFVGLDVAAVPIFGEYPPPHRIIRVGDSWENEGIKFEACENTFYNGDLVMGIWAEAEILEVYLLLGDEWPVTKWPFIRKLYAENRYTLDIPSEWAPVGEPPFDDPSSPPKLERVGEETIEICKITEAWIVSEPSQP